MRLAAVAAASSCALSACSSSGARFQWRQVSIARVSQCLPVAFTSDAQMRGLQGVRHVARPMVFAYSPPGRPSFWMKDTPAPLTGVWVGSSNRVIGYWHGEPNSTDLHDPPAPIAAVVEYGPGASIPPLGSGFQIGRTCSPDDSRL